MPTFVNGIKIALSSTGERMYMQLPPAVACLTRADVLNLAGELLRMAEGMRSPVLDKPFQSKVE